MKKLVNILLILVLVYPIQYGYSHNPKANPKAVVKDEKVRFTILTASLIRMEWNNNNEFTDDASFIFINRNLPKPDYKVKKSSKWLSIETDQLTLKYLRKSGKFNKNNLTITFKINDTEKSWNPSLKDNKNLKGTSRTLDGYTGGKNWNGEPVQLEEGLLSKNGWVLIDDSENFLFDNSEWNWVKEREKGKRQDWYFFGHGHNYKKALKDFTAIAGKIPMPPKFAFGYWWSRYWVYSDPELKDLMKQMRSYDIPIDVLVIDMDWHETFGGLKNTHKPQIDETGHKLGWTGYTWNKNLFPNPEKFLKWTNKFNLKTALNLHPASGIAPMEEQYVAFSDKIGLDTSSKKYIPYQMAKKKWAQTYFDVVLQPMEKQGVDFWWLDWQQEKESKYVNGLNNTWWINHTFFTDMDRRGEKRGLLFHRWGGLGNHRYQIGFSGDDKIHWESLRYQTYFTPTASNVGYTYWSHDIGGHAASEWSTDPQLYLRWIQFGVFSPIFRTHSAKISSVERRFWKYTDHFEMMREMVQLRYQLVPYIYNAAKKTYNEGIGLLRPMYYENPGKEEAYVNKHQYFFGDDMIVAPIADSVSTNTQLANREIWLPDGDWFELFTGTMLKGDKSYSRKYALHEVPVFIKAGAIIPMYPKINHLQNEIDTLLLRVFPGGNDELNYYEDDGKTNGYKNNEFTITKIVSEQTKENLKLSIHPIKGNYKGMNPKRAYKIMLPNSLPPNKIRVNGSEIKFERKSNLNCWSYDGKNLETIIQIPLTDKSKKIEIEVDFQITDTLFLNGKKGSFKRLTYAVSQMKVEVARSSWWATMPNSVLNAEQTPVIIEYDPQKALEYIKAFDENYDQMLKDLKNHPNARKEVAEMWVDYLTK